MDNIKIMKIASSVSFIFALINFMLIGRKEFYYSLALWAVSILIWFYFAIRERKNNDF